MENLFLTSQRMVMDVPHDIHRYLYDKIDWNARLIMIKGARGVGKTIMMLQHMCDTFDSSQEALYVSLDQLWFTEHTISELVDYHYAHGGTHLFLDEVHRYPGNWQQELKLINDSYRK